MYRLFSAYGLLLTVLTAFAQDFKDEVNFNYQYYTDNNGTRVYQSAVRGTKTVTNKTSVSLHAVIDAVSSASRKYYFPVKNRDRQDLIGPDGITSASQDETRREGGVHISQKIRHHVITLGVKTGDETDYRSTSINLNLSSDVTLTSKMSLNVARYMDDYTPKVVRPSFFKAPDGIHQQAEQSVPEGGSKIVNIASFGWSQTFTPRTVGTVSWGFVKSDGFLGNPYRQVLVEDTLHPDAENIGGTFYHESHPDNRLGNTLALNLKQHFPSFFKSSALHIDYQYYFDNWAISSHSASAQVYQYIFKNAFLRLGYRYYQQSAALFYRDRYSLRNVNRNSTDFLSYMVVDPKLSEFYSHLIQVKTVFALRDFFKPNLERTIAFFPTRLHLEVERYIRSTHKDEEIRVRRYENYNEKGFKAWTVRGGISFVY